jgi:hypothetical protein
MGEGRGARKIGEMKRIALPLLLLLLALPLMAAEIELKSAVDKNTVALDDTVTYTLTISGGEQDLPVPPLPAISNLTVVANYRSTNVSIVNGQMSAASSLSFVLKPGRVGDASIGAARLDHKGKTYQAPALALKVTPADGKAAARRQPAANPFDPFDEALIASHFFPQQTVKDPIKVAMTASRTTAYVNQMIVLTFTFYRRVNLWQAPSFLLPATDGFWTVNLPPSRELRQAVINGVPYLAQDFRTALFPLASGLQTIKGASLKADLGAGPTVFKTEPLTINVLPLPADGKPADFGGSVGGYRLSVAPSVKEIERGKPFTLIAKVFGEGNIQSASEPVLPEGEGYKKISSTSTEKVMTGAASVSGTKTFEIAVMPLKEGKLELPPLSFSYFDPAAGQYVQLRSQPVIISVLHSNAPLPRGLDPKKQNPDGSVRVNFAWRPLTKKILGFVFQPVTLALFSLAFMAALISFAWRRYRQALLSDPASLRRSRALKLARGRLKKAGHLMRAGELHEFAAELQTAVGKYLGDKYNFSAAGITTDGLREILSGKGIKIEEQREIEAFLAECDLIRFTPSQFDRAKAKDLLVKAESLIVLIESN